MLEWWLYLKTELPDDPVRIARQSNWGQGQLAKVSTLTRNENQADHETGRPALYDNAIDTNYTHSIGIQKAKSNPHDTPSQTHFLSFNPQGSLSLYLHHVSARFP